jgi:hypothetical protein
MRERYWTGVRPPRNRGMLIALPVVVMMAVSLILGMRIAGHGAATLRLTSRATPTPAARQGSPHAAHATVPPAAAPATSPAGPASPGSTPNPSAVPTAAATALATAVP